MKTVTQVSEAVERRLRTSWHLTVAGDVTRWSQLFPLGRPDRATVTHRWPEVQRWAFGWRDWAAKHDLVLVWEGRQSGASHDLLPTHLVVPDADAAAALLPGWPPRLARGRARYTLLAERFPDAPVVQVVRSVDDWTDTDVCLLVAAAEWFGRHPDTGLSPRQVPIEGLHAKWLGGHSAQVLALSGLDDLGVVEPRLTPVNFTYLDPDHLAAGRRRHDSVLPGDVMHPAYLPTVVLITENKDTAILFPQLRGAIAVQGGGKSGPAFLPRIPWMADAPTVIYWGDLDAAGFEIVNMYRQAGINATTILMDLSTLRTYRRFAATTDTKSRPLTPDRRKVLPYLSDGERETYDALTDPSLEWPVRVEQERIPLVVALETLLRRVNAADSWARDQV